MELVIDDRQEKVEMPDDIMSEIEIVVNKCLEYEGKSQNCEVSISFVDDEEIRNLNREYRGKDKPTDVLSFPLVEEENPINNMIPVLLGDVVISSETSLRQAKEYGHSLKREILYLTVHSMFHLFGYDHMDEEEKKIMRNKEKAVMKELGVFKNS